MAYAECTLSEDPIIMKNPLNRSETIIRTLLRNGKIPGIAVTVTKNNHLLWQQGYGYADLAKKLPVNPETTLFRIASISKPLTATALACMVRDGMIKLEDSIYKYVPHFPEKQYDITIKQLATHRSGIRSYKGKELLNNKPLSIKEGIELFKNDPLRFTPGTHYLYSSYNWNLIALAMQEIAGIPFETYVKEQVLRPLHMHHTVAATKEGRADKAVSYVRDRAQRFRELPPLNDYYKLGSGGYLSTSADVARLGNAWLYGNFLPQPLKTQFLTPSKVKEASTGYGIGWETGSDNQQRPWYGHAGNGLGAYGLFYVYPEQDMVFSLLTNGAKPGTDAELRKIIKYLLEEAAPGNPPL